MPFSTKKAGPAWTADNIHRIYTRVAPGYIRVDADEVTYPLHIMLRYRLERAMLAGDLALADLRAGRWYARRVLPVLLATWAVWLPVVSCVYALPPPLQIPLFNVVLCFWSLLFAHILARQIRQAAPPIR